MKIKFTMGKTEMELETPKSLGICMDFMACWGEEQNRTKLGRLCAASIGACAPRGRGIASYDITQADPYSYGFGVQETLLEAGIPPSDIYEIGHQLLVSMAERIPTSNEVDSAVNFTGEGGGG